MVAHVRDVEQSVLGQLLLHADEVALDIAVARDLGHPGDVIRRLVEGGYKASRIALIDRRIAAWSDAADGDNLCRQRVAVIRRRGSRLNDGGELGLRRVNGQ